MTIYATPSSTFPATASGQITGLVGTMGVRIRNPETGVDVVARTTVGITEQPAGSKLYFATLTAPATEDTYSVIWDDGSAFAAEDLIVTYTLPSSVPSGPSFATYGDLEERLGAIFDAAEQTRATALLADASDLVRQAARQEISLHLNDVVTMRGFYDGNFVLPQRPVLAIDSVTTRYGSGSAVAVDPTSYYLDGDELVMQGWRSQTQFDIGGGWYGPDYELVVTYDHGFAVTPALARAITVEAVARVWMNPFGASSSMIAGTQFQFPHQGLALTDDEEKKLAAAFRRTKYSVQLR